MLVPMTALINELPEPVPEFVMVPVLLTSFVDSVTPLAVVLLLFKTRLPVPPTPPFTVSIAVLLLVSVVPPALTVSKPLVVNADVVLFSVMPVTLLPILALISELPEPVPELVMVPVLFTSFVDNVMPLADVLLFFRIKLPVPVTPLVNVRIAVLLFIIVVPPALTFIAPLTVRADVVLFSVTPVTLVPIFALISELPLPAPEFVIVPVLFTSLVDRVMVPTPVAFSVRLPVPVMPPLSVRLLAAGDKLRL